MEKEDKNKGKVINLPKKILKKQALRGFVPIFYTDEDGTHTPILDIYHHYYMDFVGFSILERTTFHLKRCFILDEGGIHSTDMFRQLNNKHHLLGCLKSMHKVNWLLEDHYQLYHSLNEMYFRLYETAGIDTNLVQYKNHIGIFDEKKGRLEYVLEICDA